MTAARRKYYAEAAKSRVTETMIMAYKTDVWHTHESRELIGVCSNINSAVNICHKRAIKEDQQIDFVQHQLLNRILQTQDYQGEGEFYLEEQPIDILL